MPIRVTRRAADEIHTSDLARRRDSAVYRGILILDVFSSCPDPMINIDRLTEAELVDLNHRIVARLRLLNQMRAHLDMLVQNW